jgi:hypothetical protein
MCADREDPRRRPDIAMSGDFIVGFPGERDGDFEKTLALVREVGFAAPSRSNIRAAPAPRPRPCPARSTRP